MSKFSFQLEPTNLARLHYNTVTLSMFQRLIFLQTDVSLFFLVGAVTRRDLRSSTSKCEVFTEGMDVSMKTTAIELEFLTVLCIDTAISTCCDPRVPGKLG